MRDRLNDSVGFKYPCHQALTQTARRCITMCSVGDVTGIDVNTLKPDEYECMDCHNTFKGIGKRVTCPSCRSSDVKKIK